jgi:RNA-directed DNA polymerase
MAERKQTSMGGIPEAGAGGYGRNPESNAAGASNVTARKMSDCLQNERLMEAVVERKNMREAYERVKRNKGATGIDGMTVDELAEHLCAHWLRVKKELLEGEYVPQPVLQVEIPKQNGGVRKLGIPTVTDRLIQQAVHQVLEPHYDPAFSESSYGFRKGRSAQDALRQSMEYIGEGKNWVVDIDLEKFFDRVNHDILMAMLARRIKDKRVLKLIRRCLQSGIMVEGVVTARTEGTPQGSPLSPLLSNILLDVMDKELEKRGHAFCRYADDCNIYLRSRRAGERVMESVQRFLGRKLKLKVNEEKSKVDRPWNIKFLGYSTTMGGKARLKPATSSVKRFKGKLKKVLRKGRGRSLEKVIAELSPIIRGWYHYFKLSGVRSIFEDLDGVAAHFRLTETQLFFAGSADREKTFAGRIDR